MKALTKNELLLVNGGASLPKWIKGGLWVTAFRFVYDHWNEIKSGAIDGWEDAGKELESW